MLIVGAKGFAKEVLEVVRQLDELDNLVFFDDVNEDAPDKLFGQFPVLRTIREVAIYFKTIDCRFTIGIGNPLLRKNIYDKFINLGGKFTSVISSSASIGAYDVRIGTGSNILTGSILANGSILGKGCIVYYNSVITHDCVVGDFVELSPSITLLGRSVIGSYSQIGSSATILPDIKVGENVIIGAGSIVIKDLPDNCVAVGIPAKIIKELTPLEF